MLSVRFYSGKPSFYLFILLTPIYQGSIYIVAADGDAAASTQQGSQRAYLPSQDLVHRNNNTSYHLVSSSFLRATHLTASSAFNLHSNII